MVQKAIKFTPEVLLSAPRRSAGTPNPAGDAVLYTVQTYDFKTHKKENAFRLLETKTGDTHDILKDKDVSSFNWLDDEQFLFLCSESDGKTNICVGHVPRSREASDASSESHTYVAGTIDAPASDLRVTKLPHGKDQFGIVFAAQASPDGSLFNSETAKKTHSTGRLYSNLFVRHWDRYEGKEKNALFFAQLSKGHHDNKFGLGKIINAIKGTGLESPIATFGGTDNFDICHHCIIFVAKDPDLDPALNTKVNVYLIRMVAWDEGAVPVLEQVVVRGFEGASSSPVISPDGSKAAFLAMKKNGYEADRNEVFILPLEGGLQLVQKTLVSSEGGDGVWDRNPASICFSADGKSLLAVAEEVGTAKVFMLDADLGAPADVRPLTKSGYVNDVACLANGSIFISGSTLVDNSFYAIVDPHCKPSASGDLTTWTHSYSAHGNKLGLKPEQVSSIWTPASNPDVNKEIHSIVVKPSNFDSSKKYPVAYLIHGGPQGSWANSWSTRWNLAVYAEQGYIVVAPNVTGSTGYGQRFVDSIRDNWGHDPYQDIVNCFEWVGKNLDGADNERAVALGASFGGYMVNWIQGHDLGRKFKAMVCHDGVLTMPGMLSTEELYFPFQEFGGTPWHHSSTSTSDKGNLVQGQRNFGSATVSDWRRWDPSEHFTQWSTPQLVIHNSKDYRICIADGLAAFNVLQARGIDSQFLTFPDENHWVLKPENSLVWHKVVLNWINKYVGLPALSEEDPEGEEFWGGAKAAGEETVDMMALGKPET